MPHQTDWRFCTKCFGMFWDGAPQKGQCPASGVHTPAGFNFTVPHDLPGTLDFDFPSIVFATGIPVGGSSHLTLREDGSYKFSGHLHDSGADEFNTSVAWAVKDSQNQVYTFAHSGHVSGTFESGSRDDNWAEDSKDDRLAANWVYLGAGATWRSNAKVNADLTNVVNSAIGAIGTILGVVSIIGASGSAGAAAAG